MPEDFLCPDCPEKTPGSVAGCCCLSCRDGATVYPAYCVERLKTFNNRQAASVSGAACGMVIKKC